MQRRKNDRARSKKSPAPAPALDEIVHQIPIPPSPPVFMLDDDHLPVAVANRPSTYTVPGHGDDSDSDLRLPPPVSHSAPTTGAATPQISDTSRSTSPGPPEPAQLLPSHSVAPTLISKPTMIESLTRAVLYMVPNPAPAPALPKKRRPMSFSTFVGDSFGKGKGAAAGLISTTLSPLLTPLNVAGSRTHDLPNVTVEEDDRDPALQSPDPAEEIVFCTWMQSDRGSKTSLLFLGYAQGFQIWDTTSLGSLQELVNVKNEDGAGFGTVFAACLLNARDGSDGELSVALLVNHMGSSDTELIIYSLGSNSIIFRKSIPCALRLESSLQLLVISSINPPMLHLISTTTFQDIQTLRSVSSPPVFTLSGRFLAFACPPPQEKERHLYSNPGVIARSPPRNPIGGAIKVGQGIYSGIKALGGMAVATASSRHSPDPDQLQKQSPSNQWYSKSAPATSYLAGMSQSPPNLHGNLPGSPQLMPVPDNMTHDGSWVTVMDAKTNNEIHRFQASSNKPVTYLHWSSCGTLLHTANLDGQTVSVYSIRPRVSSGANAGFASGLFPASRTKRVEQGIPWHIYDLNRGHTSATVLSIATSNDGLWTLVGTQRGTLHVFATNPYGGPSDINSHLRGEVSNAAQIQPLSTALVPMVRIKPTSLPTNIPGLMAPLAVRVLTREESQNLPHPLLPDKRSSKDAGGYEDVLVFLPDTGAIELYRINLTAAEAQPSRGRGTVSHARRKPSVSETSATEQSSSPSGGGASALTRMMDSNTQGVITLQGRERHLALWNVSRAKDWSEVQRPIVQTSGDRGGARLNRNWLAEAEISTCSRSPNVMPPSIYSSHQFSFFSFGDEWDALLRSDRFVLPLSPIHVRQEVEVLASADGAGFIQGGTISTARERAGSGSKGYWGETVKPHLDEPMANALSDSMHHLAGSPPTYPMFPNGFPSVGTGRVVDTAPIRRSAQFVGEGLGKLGREIATVVRSPRIPPHSNPAPELDQDLEDEEFLDHEPEPTDADGDSHSHSGVSGSISTPDEDEGRNTKWDEWGEEEMAALEEVERFDEIYPAGMMEEDEGSVMRTPTKPRRGRKGR